MATPLKLPDAFLIGDIPGCGVTILGESINSIFDLVQDEVVDGTVHKRTQGTAVYGVPTRTMQAIFLTGHSELAEVDYSAYDGLLGALFLNGHWTVVYTNFESKTILYLDSAGTENENNMRPILLRNWQKHLREKGYRPCSGWQVEFLPHEEQNDQISCGVHALSYVRCIATDGLQADVQTIDLARERIEIISCLTEGMQFDDEMCHGVVCRQRRIKGSKQVCTNCFRPFHERCIDENLCTFCIAYTAMRSTFTIQQLHDRTMMMTLSESAGAHPSPQSPPLTPSEVLGKASAVPIHSEATATPQSTPETGAVFNANAESAASTYTEGTAAPQSTPLFGAVENDNAVSATSTHTEASASTQSAPLISGMGNPNTASAISTHTEASVAPQSTPLIGAVVNANAVFAISTDTEATAAPESTPLIGAVANNNALSATSTPTEVKAAPQSTPLTDAVADANAVSAKSTHTEATITQQSAPQTGAEVDSDEGSATSIPSEATAAPQSTSLTATESNSNFGCATLASSAETAAHADPQSTQPTGSELHSDAGCALSGPSEAAGNEDTSQPCRAWRVGSRLKRKREYDVTEDELERRRHENFSKTSYTSYLRRGHGSSMDDLPEFCRLHYPMTQRTMFTNLVEGEVRDLVNEGRDILLSSDIRPQIFEGVDPNAPYSQQISRIAANIATAVPDSHANMLTHGFLSTVLQFVLQYLCNTEE